MTVQDSAMTRVEAVVWLLRPTWTDGIAGQQCTHLRTIRVISRISVSDSTEDLIPVYKSL